MGPFNYRTPTGDTADKRMWPIGSLVRAKLTGGTVLETVTASVPQRYAGGGWCVRVRGAAYALALERVDPRFQPNLLQPEPEGAAQNDKQIDAADEGHRAG